MGNKGVEIANGSDGGEMAEMPSHIFRDGSWGWFSELVGLGWSIGLKEQDIE